MPNLLNKMDVVFSVKIQLAHFTVTDGSEAGVDLALMQPFLLYYVNHVVLMLTSIFFFCIISIRKGKRFVSKEGQPQPHVHSEARILSPQVQNSQMSYCS